MIVLWRYHYKKRYQTQSLQRSKRGKGKAWAVIFQRKMFDNPKGLVLQRRWISDYICVCLVSACNGVDGSMFSQILSLEVQVKLGIVKNDNKKPTTKIEVGNCYEKV